MALLVSLQSNEVQMVRPYGEASNEGVGLDDADIDSSTSLQSLADASPFDSTASWSTNFKTRADTNTGRGGGSDIRCSANCLAIPSA